jgi:hypothetical protein
MFSINLRTPCHPKHPRLKAAVFDEGQRESTKTNQAGHTMHDYFVGKEFSLVGTIKAPSKPEQGAESFDIQLFAVLL